MRLAKSNTEGQRYNCQFLLRIALAVISVLVFSHATAHNVLNPPQRVASEPLQINLVRSKIVWENGREAAREATVAKPGDVLEEVATYTNSSQAILKSVEATLPVPQNTELVLASIKPVNAKASIDGKSFSAIPLVRKLRQPNGVEVEQSIPLSDYRYLRWYPGDLVPNKPMSFSARFTVANNPTSTSSPGK